MKEYRATVTHDSYADAYYVQIKKKKSVKQLEQRLTVIWDFDDKGNVIGIEILEKP